LTSEKELKQKDPWTQAWTSSAKRWPVDEWFGKSVGGNVSSV